MTDPGRSNGRRIPEFIPEVGKCFSREFFPLPDLQERESRNSLTQFQRVLLLFFVHFSPPSAPPSSLCTRSEKFPPDFRQLGKIQQRNQIFFFLLSRSIPEFLLFPPFSMMWPLQRGGGGKFRGYFHIQNIKKTGIFSVCDTRQTQRVAKLLLV